VENGVQSEKRYSFANPLRSWGNGGRAGNKEGRRPKTNCVLECSGLTELWMRGPHRLKSKAVSSHCTKMPASDRTRTRIYDTLDGWLNRWKKDGRKLRQIFGPQPKALSLDLLVSYFHYR
jgi:hypothetical protein